MKISNFQFPISKRLGFTLIELLVVVAITGSIGIVLTSLFIGQNRIYVTQTAQLNITGDGRGALDDIDNYVRQANRTASSYSSYIAGSQILILQIQSVNATNQLLPGVFDYVVYYLSNGSLFRQVFPDPSSARIAITKKLASNVNGLVFTLNNANYALVTEVKTDITLQEQAGSQIRAITLSSNSRLRNY